MKKLSMVLTSSEYKDYGRPRVGQPEYVYKAHCLIDQAGDAVRAAALVPCSFIKGVKVSDETYDILIKKELIAPEMPTDEKTVEYLKTLPNPTPWDYWEDKAEEALSPYVATAAFEEQYDQLIVTVLEFIGMHPEDAIYEEETGTGMIFHLIKKR